MLPSVKTLSRAFPDNAKTARRILELSRAQLLAENSAAQKRERECYHAPKTWDLRLSALNECGAFHGVESLQSQKGDFLMYLNAGDSYAETLIFWNGRFYASTLGDFLEKLEKRRIFF